MDSSPCCCCSSRSRPFCSRYVYVPTDTTIVRAWLRLFFRTLSVVITPFNFHHIYHRSSTHPSYRSPPSHTPLPSSLPGISLPLLQTWLRSLGQGVRRHSRGGHVAARHRVARQGDPQSAAYQGNQPTNCCHVMSFYVVPCHSISCHVVMP